MTRKSFCGYAILTLAMVVGYRAGTVSQVAPLPRNILFIGDSFTYTQGGIYTHFEKLAAAATPPRNVSTDKVVAGGAYLKRLWEMQSAVKAIDTGAFDVVVLQDDIPETNVDYFRQYARMFVDEVRQNKGRPVLFMAWPTPALDFDAANRAGASRPRERAQRRRRSGRAGLAGGRQAAARPRYVRVRPRASEYLRNVSRHLCPLRYGLRRQSPWNRLRSVRNELR
jgi:hypothetical protein